MVRKFNGDSPVNARIKIDYRGKKPQVAFSYPDKKNQYHGSMLPYIFVVWFIVWGIGYYAVGVNEIYTLPKETVDFSNYTQCFSYYFEEDLNYCEEREDKNGFQILWSLLKEQKSQFVWMLILILPPMIIYFPFRKRWNKLYPKVNGLIARKKYMDFNPKDVQEFKGRYYCEVPLFNNVILNYDAKKEFSKYLEYFEIEEYKFYYKRKSTKKNKKKKKLNEMLWYAKFYFKQPPKTGTLKVVFK